VERRLTTILSADIAGYARLMGADEAAALAELKFRQDQLIEPLLGKSGGRLIKFLGDGFLAEFTSVVNAVHFAIDLQAASESRNGELSDDSQFHFRIGVNLSDIIGDANDIYGDGVNIAVRLEGLADPGGICISDTVYQHVRRHLACSFEDLGKRTLKNISGAVQAYRVAPGPAGAGRPRRRPQPSHEASIAVLPFTNMSGDPEQEYFSDGITEDIITDLSKISALFVVSRNTSFTFKGQSVAAEQIAVSLGVQYVLEGSVRRAGQRLRITAQLIDGRSGGHVWAERFDRDFADIFDLQDEISRAIVEALKVKILPSEMVTIAQRATDNPEAYRFYLMGRAFFNRGHTRRLLKLARQIFAKALEIDPTFARAHAGIADCNSHLLDALELDPSLAEAHASRGLALYTAGRYADAEESFRSALQCNPDLFEAHLFYGRNCFNRGHYEKAAGLFGRAAQLNPIDFRAAGLQAMCFQSLGRRAEAITAARLALERAEQAVTERPDDVDALAFGAGLLAFIGDAERTRDWAERAAVMEPDDQYMQYNLACAFSVLGEKDLAIDRLERAMRPGVLRSLKEFMLKDSDLDILRQHPRYLALLKELTDLP
jgi:adenylate cyclase